MVTRYSLVSRLSNRRLTVAAGIPVGRAGLPARIAELVVFLACARAGSRAVSAIFLMEAHAIRADGGGNGVRGQWQYLTRMLSNRWRSYDDYRSQWSV